MRGWLALLVSAAFVAAVYLRIDAQALKAALSQADYRLIGAGLAAEGLVILVTAWRFTRLVPSPGVVGLGEAARLTVVGGTLNLVLPLKLGDLAKAALLCERGRMPPARAVSLVLIEKGCGLAVLTTFVVWGLCLAPLPSLLRAAMLAVALAVLAMIGVMLGFDAPAAGISRRLGPSAGRWQEALDHWHDVRTTLWRDRRWVQLAAATYGIWLVQFFRVWLYFGALHAWLAFEAHVGLQALAAAAGFMPLTLAGVGPRDAVMVAVYAPLVGGGVAAAAALVCTAQYVLASGLGLPFLVQAIARGTFPAIASASIEPVEMPVPPEQQGGALGIGAESREAARQPE